MRLLRSTRSSRSFKQPPSKSDGPKRLPSRLASAAALKSARQAPCEVDVASYGSSLTTLEVKGGDDAVHQEPSNKVAIGLLTLPSSRSSQLMMLNVVFPILQRTLTRSLPLWLPIRCCSSAPTTSPTTPWSRRRR